MALYKGSTKVSWSSNWFNPSNSGTTGQLLTKTAAWYNWADAPETGIWSSNDTYENVIYLSQAEYDALTTKDPNTLYSTPDDAESWAFEPENVWTEWDKLQKTSAWYEWVNWELVEITEWQPADYSAMRWPCAEGFHVPLQTEWQWLKTIMDWLGLTTWDNWRINLHMPFAGYRSNDSADLSYQGSFGYYWSSSPFGSGYPNFARYLYLTSSSVQADYYNNRAGGHSVRCFKDSFEVPTSSWTVIQWTIGSAWIFWNQSDWIISITSDGSTWYTIMDKNLWATSVYNNGDTLSEANCGKYYQWGNNYWFAWTWSVTTSSTQVDASDYWPWNYYSGSTFITGSKDWSSVQNDNLRWWVTWIIPATYDEAVAWWVELAVKDYVDDELSTKVASWDSWVSYTLKVASSAPASWTANTIITIVTD